MRARLKILREEFRFKNSVPVDPNSTAAERLHKPYFTYDYPHENWKIGDWILIRHVTSRDNKIVVSRPILGLFVGMSVWDMAMVVNFVEPFRAYIGEEVLDYDPEVESIALWSDNIIPIGHWKTKPTFSELKSTLKNHLKEWEK